MAVRVIDDEEFDTSVKTGMVLVDFWAEWCGPCKMLSPILDEISNEMTDVQFTKINVEENQQVAQKMGITALPTLVLYKNGEVVEQIRGLQPKQRLISLLQKHLD